MLDVKVRLSRRCHVRVRCDPRERVCRPPSTSPSGRYLCMRSRLRQRLYPASTRPIFAVWNTVFYTRPWHTRLVAIVFIVEFARGVVLFTSVIMQWQTRSEGVFVYIYERCSKRFTSFSKFTYLDNHMYPFFIVHVRLVFNIYMRNAKLQLAVERTVHQFKGKMFNLRTTFNKNVYIFLDIIIVNCDVSMKRPIWQLLIYAHIIIQFSIDMSKIWCSQEKNHSVLLFPKDHSIVCNWSCTVRYHYMHVNVIPILIY